MPADLLQRCDELREMLVGFDPAVWSGSDCRVIAELLAATAKACAAASALAATRAASCGAHRSAGFADGAEWLARTNGTTVTEAKSAMAVAGALDDCPSTRQALVTGELSLAQAGEITCTAAVGAATESELVSVARGRNLGALREKARDLRLAATDVDDLHRRHHAAREFRHWRDAQGMVRGSFALPPQTGIPLVNRLDAETDRIRRRARREGSTEERAAHAADALLALTSGAPSSKPRSAELTIVCDLRAWRRDHAHRGEPCHIVGGGPIPVAVAKELGGDAFLKAVLHDGVAISTVAHFGRHIPAELRTALVLGAAPGFEGVGCVEAGCDRHHGLEWDHDDPVANGGPTSLANLKPRCWPHHRDKTARDRAAGLLGGRRDDRSGETSTRILRE